MRTGSALAASLLLFSLTCLMCTKGEEAGIVARVGQSVLTLQEVRERNPGAGTGAARSQAERYIQHWIESELLYQEALLQGVDKQPEVQRALKELSRDYIISAFSEQAANAAVSVSDEEIQRYYQEQKEEFQAEADLYHLLLILVQNQNEALQLRRELIGGTPFSEIASRNSLDGSRLHGGDLGYVPLSALSPMLARAVSAMQPGSLSAPVKSELGYNLLRLVDVQRKGATRALEEVQPVIKQRITARKKDEALQNLISRLSSEAALYTDMTKLESLEGKQ